MNFTGDFLSTTTGIFHSKNPDRLLKIRKLKAPMQDYTHYKAEALLMEDSFLNYCGKKNDADTAFWESYVQQHPHITEEVNLAKDMYHALSITVPTEETQLAFDKFKLAINNSADLHSITTTPVIPIHRTGRKRLYAIVAAATMIGIIITAIFYNNSPAGKFNQPLDYSQSQFVQAFYSAPDQRKTITLPDGSTVVLNNGSTITLEKDFNKNARWLRLEGEAFFSVKADKNKPFVVITGKTATTALGTSFKVRNYNTGTSDVMLATGKVNVQSLQPNNNNGGDIILMPGEAATVNDKGQLMKSVFDVNLLEDWNKNRIAFNNASLDEIIQKLEFHYGVQVIISNKPLKPIAFTGKFLGNTLKEVLEALAFTNKFGYTHTSNTVSIRFNK